MPTRSRVPLRLGAVALTLCAAFALLPAFAFAREITVNTTADNAPSVSECAGAPGDCSLRQALNYTNSNPDPDTIILPAGNYALTIAGSGENEANTGDLDLVEDTDTTIQGAGARTTVIDASGVEDRVLDVHSRALLSLTKLTLTGGHVTGEYGGGMYAEEALLTMSDVAIRGNVSAGEGRGGGLAVNESQTTIVDSLIAENRNSGDGGGLWTSQGEIAITNTTIANNGVDTGLYPGNSSWGAYGGAWEMNDGTVHLQNVTIAGNFITDTNGGSDGSGTAIDGAPAFATVVNTIIYGNSGSNIESLNQCDTKLESTGGHNIEQPTQGQEGDERCFEDPTDLTVDPLLGPLANNGGETDTLALLSGSPAIDAADAGNCPATDQRGLPRPQLGGCDIGAFEVQPPPPPPAVMPISAPAKPTIKRKGKVKVKPLGKTFLVKPGYTVSCPAGGSACTGTIKARARKPKMRNAGASAAKKALIGKAKFTVAAGKTKKLSLKLNRKGAKMLRLATKLRARFEVRSAAGTGPQAVAKATLKLKLPARHPRR